MNITESMTLYKLTKKLVRLSLKLHEDSCKSLGDSSFSRTMYISVKDITDINKTIKKIKKLKKQIDEQNSFTEFELGLPYDVNDSFGNQFGHSFEDLFGIVDSCLFDDEKDETDEIDFSVDIEALKMFFGED